MRTAGGPACDFVNGRPGNPNNLSDVLFALAQRRLVDVVPGEFFSRSSNKDS
jgi:hypothetical protein